jgi:SAM-dependent methyltransferase
MFRKRMNMTSAASTSLNSLNADKQLGMVKRIFWALLNIINNSYYPHRNTNINIRQFSPNIPDAVWAEIPKTISPARGLTELFLLNINWRAVQSELGDLNVFDTGCGSGRYGLMLAHITKSVLTYFGIDTIAHDQWRERQEENNYLSFKQISSDDIFDSIPENTNFFFTNSSMEHIENDLKYFRQIKAFIDKTKNNTIQIHFLPSSACLWLYLWHGIRQYTPRTVSKIIDLFGHNCSYSILYSLGGNSCNRLHYRFITKPLLWALLKSGFRMRVNWIDGRKKDTEEYWQALKAAIDKDTLIASSNPTYYALVIHSNYNERLFENMQSLTVNTID